jgi:site-specific recombinase
VNEIVCLIRSQFASIVGNLALIIPVTLVLNFLILWITGHPMMPVKSASANLDTFSILGPSLFYGGFTGVLLWASSLVGAWADNWFVCHRIGEALATDRRFVRMMGTSRALKFSRFWSKNIAGLGGNISFGCMLGFIPELAHFAGLPLNIRHVTLSTSMVTADVAALGAGTLATAPFWLAVLGLFGIGCMNLLVSFSLALLLAIRARGIDSPNRQAIYSAMWERLRRQPLSFILPVGTANLAPEPAVEPV